MSRCCLLLLLFALTISACDRPPDLAREKKAILLIHQRQRKAHLEKNAALLLQYGSPDFIEINRGLVKHPSRQESLARFNTYFESVRFLDWEDASEPIVTFSDDATMATTIVEKFVVTSPPTMPDRKDTVHYAWLAVYKKENGNWQLAQLASTDR